jgi:[CysO sulfur-carrier protein]-S-L-cysteine hydrolase
MTLKIARQVLDDLIAHARNEAPFECCGLLAGKNGLIDECIRLRNVRASTVAYEIDPKEHIESRKRLRELGRSILGAYHSHPRTAATPSATDVAEAYYDEGFVYVIVSLERESPDVRVYRVAERDLVALDFEPVL